jgi:hypothetical protein
MDMKDNHTRLATFGVLLLALLLIANGVITPLAQGAISAQEQAAPAAISANELRVTGSYAGAVIVDEPASLGALDLVFTMTDQGGALSGQVNAAKTQVFLGGPSFTGAINASSGVTPTFHIDSAVFTGVVSGRPVQRQFTLTGEVLDEANTLRGQYTETITGFTPKPLLVKGKFLVVRPNGSEVIIQDPGTDTPTPTPTHTVTGTPPTSTPTSTATATPDNPGGPNTSAIYLPVIMQKAGVVSSAVVAPGPADGVLTVVPTTTPEPPRTQKVPTSERSHTSYLPVVVK